MERKLLAKAYVKLRAQGPEHFVNFYQNGTRVFRSTYDLSTGEQDEYCRDGRQTFATYDACMNEFNRILSKNKNILVSLEEFS